MKVLDYTGEALIDGFVVATFGAVIGRRRLRFAVLKVPNNSWSDFTVTELRSLARFPEMLADRKARGVSRVTEARDVIRRAVKKHGSAHVLRVIDACALKTAGVLAKEAA